MFYLPLKYLNLSPFLKFFGRGIDRLAVFCYTTLNANFGVECSKKYERRTAMEESLLKEFQKYYEVKPTDPAKKILFAVLDDLFGRKGLDNEWDGIDDDVREELLATNLELVKKNLP